MVPYIYMYVPKYTCKNKKNRYKEAVQHRTFELLIFLVVTFMCNCWETFCNIHNLLFLIWISLKHGKITITWEGVEGRGRRRRRIKKKKKNSHMCAWGLATNPSVMENYLSGKVMSTSTGPQPFPSRLKSLKMCFYSCVWGCVNEMQKWMSDCVILNIDMNKYAKPHDLSPRVPQTGSFGTYCWM